MPYHVEIVLDRTSTCRTKHADWPIARLPVTYNDRLCAMLLVRPRER